MSAPNLLLISSYDMGRHLGCYGRAHTPTPCLDDLAEDGVRGEIVFATATICSPSRASLTFGWTDADREPEFPPHVAPEESLRRHLLGLQRSL